jgi:hypothetical protein
MKYRFQGGCHCGAVRVRFASEIAPADIEVRACQCDFCRRQGSEAVSDPAGLLEISSLEPAAIRRYRFGHGLADYLSCAVCAIYLGAVTETSDGLRGFTLIRILDDRELFDRKPVAADFDGEGRDQRQARRMSRWTPAVLRSAAS